MHVEVGDTLADHVVHSHKGPRSVATEPHRRLHPGYEGEERPNGVARQFRQGGDMAARNHQNVSEEQWSAVEEGMDLLIAPHPESRLDAGGDPTEKTTCPLRPKERINAAISHMTSLPSILPTVGRPPFGGENLHPTEPASPVTSAPDGDPEMNAEVAPPAPGWMRQDWMAQGLCHGKTQMFFAPHAERPQTRARREAQARAICQECPQLEPCRTYARLHCEYGFWGGESESDRARAGYAVPWPVGASRRRNNLAATG